MKAFSRSILAILILALCSSCKATYEYDKKRIVIFTFGVGLAFISDKEGEAKAETNSKNREGEE